MNQSLKSFLRRVAAWSIFGVALFVLGQFEANVVSAQQTPANCPEIRITCPPSISDKESPIFKLEVTGIDPAKLTFNWSPSIGTIKMGQGTATLTLDVTGLGGQTTTATVDVGGTDPSCPRITSCSTEILGVPEPVKVDVLGQPLPSEADQKLDSFLIALNKDPHALGYIIGYGGRVAEKTGEAQAAADKAKTYLVEKRGMDSSRLVTVDGGYRENLAVELWIVPRGAKPPDPTPTVSPDDVTIVPPSKPATKRIPRTKKP